MLIFCLPYHYQCIILELERILDYYKQSVELMIKLIDNLITKKQSEMQYIIHHAQSQISRKKTAKAGIDEVNKKKALFWIPIYGTMLKRELELHQIVVDEVDASLETAKIQANSLNIDIRQYNAARSYVLTLYKKYNIPKGERYNASPILKRLKTLYDASLMPDTTRWKEMKYIISILTTFVEAHNEDVNPTVVTAPAIISKRDIDNARERVNQRSANPEANSGHRPKGQMAFDFIKPVEKTDLNDRIWLPVPASRKQEFIDRGAKWDANHKKGSKLWIPKTPQAAAMFQDVVPLMYRSNREKFEFPPIRPTAVGQNLWSIFDQTSWNHIRKISYDNAGHRCQLCGKQMGSLYKAVSTPEEFQKGGLVDCHEVWDWEIIDGHPDMGIQKLKRFLVVCKDCHFMFHEGYLRDKAANVGIEEKAVNYINYLRGQLNNCDQPTLMNQLAVDNAKWESTRGVDNWFMDLSHLGQQGFMMDHIPTLKEDNRAGVDYSMLAGVNFKLENGTFISAQRIEDVVKTKLITAKMGR